MPRTLQIAIREAVGKRGVSVIVLPGDVALQSAVDAPAPTSLSLLGPVLVDAVVNRQELAMPPKITFEMAKGFTLYMVKAVLNGRANEVLDLAVTNLSR
jgi:pyruvate dehydrogenase (quinone)